MTTQPDTTPLPYDIHAWPYTNQPYKINDEFWRETCEKVYWDQLECVPPARIERGAFLVGECSHHDHSLGAMYACFVQINERYFCKYQPIKFWQPNLYKQEIRAQFNLE